MYNTILVALDDSSTAQNGLREAIRLAANLKAALCVLHVIEVFPLTSEFSTAAQFEESLNRTRHRGEALLSAASTEAAAAGVAVETSMFEARRSTVAQAVVDEAVRKGCGLIVMGTHGRRGFERLTLGSEAEQVVRASPVPVLLVRRGTGSVDGADDAT